jgi:hypothetical protein
MSDIIYVNEVEFNKIEGIEIIDISGRRIKLTSGFLVQLQKGAYSAEELEDFVKNGLSTITTS